MIERVLIHLPRPALRLICAMRVRVEIMGLQKCRIVGKSQPVPIMMFDVGACRPHRIVYRRPPAGLGATTGVRHHRQAGRHPLRAVGARCERQVPRRYGQGNRAGAGRVARLVRGTPYMHAQFTQGYEGWRSQRTAVARRQDWRDIPRVDRCGHVLVGGAWIQINPSKWQRQWRQSSMQSIRQRI
jgi:hypothetical protein